MSEDAAKLTRMAAEYAAAWSSRSAEAVADFYATDGQITINRGDVLKGRAALVEMAEAFFAAYPDLVVHCDDVRGAGGHALFAWTLEGHHAETGNYVKVGGWEEWELDGDLKVKASLGWYDAAEEQRQIAGGG
ncbi:MAG: SgcJ/EcaC family oxidoreductase [Hyphomicrobiales bacterium]|nr:SgcJ/EcaC family oxidoreductase [Hyphomicrobiales bacterium]